MSKKIIPYEWWAQNHTDKCVTLYDNDIARASSINEAVFIRRFIYLWEANKHNGEMYIIPNNFCQPIGMTKYCFRKIVKEWEDKGIIRTKSKGLPLKKWYKLSEKKLAKYLSFLKENGVTSQGIKHKNICYRIQQEQVVGSNKIYNKYKIRKKNTLRRLSAPGCDSSSSSYFDGMEKGTKYTIEDFEYQCSVRLYKAMKNNGRRITTRTRYDKWCDEFRKMLRLGIARSELEWVLGWLEKKENMTNIYTPKFKTAQEFRKKYSNIIDAIERSGDILNEDPRKKEAEERRKQAELTEKTIEWLNEGM